MAASEPGASEAAQTRTAAHHPTEPIRLASANDPTGADTAVRSRSRGWCLKDGKQTAPTTPARPLRVPVSGASGTELRRLGHRVEIVEEGGDPAGIGLVHDRPGAAGRGDHVEGADALFDAGDALRGHRQFAQPEPQEQRGIAWVAGEFAADADRDAPARRGLDG